MKIVHLEDNLLDAELVRATLHPEWPDCKIERVDTRSDFVALLSSGEHDLILSDFNMGQFNGLEALEIARQAAPQVPFIFLSGTIGEDRAIAALQAGASDYVSKDRPKRLVTSIRRALREAEERRQRKEAEEQLLRMQRLENVGMLAAGIAHDFNNVLAPILMAAPLIRDQIADPGLQKIVTNMEKSAQRGAGLVRQILGFAQGASGEPQLIQVKHILHELLGVVRQTFPPTIVVKDEIRPGIPTVRGNPTQVHQILLNLCVNARDAMPQGGTLTLFAETRHLDPVVASAIEGGRSGRFLVMGVSDTGTGIPPEILSRVWEPFFTTKTAGHGTGLGLSTVRGIVENHQGFVRLTTKLGQGTAFEIFLPAAEETVPPMSTEKTSTAKRGSGELILVVDDDVNVRDVIAATLVRHGYRIATATDGTEAVALFAPRNLEFRLVIADVSMPNLNGTQLARVVRSLNPAVAVIMISGLAEEQERARNHTFDGSFLPKPFSSELLLNTVYDAIHVPAGGPPS